MSSTVAVIQYLTKRQQEVRQMIEDYPQGGYQRELDIIETILDLIEDTQVEHFWIAVERGWDIEQRSYFESEAVKMGFKSPVEMAVHHLWKRRVKEDAPASPGPVGASRDEILAQVNKALIHAGSRHIVGTKDGAIVSCTVEEAVGGPVGASGEPEIQELFEQLLQRIESGHRGSIGSIDNTYLPQIGVDEVARWRARAAASVPSPPAQEQK